MSKKNIRMALLMVALMVAPLAVAAEMNETSVSGTSPLVAVNVTASTTTINDTGLFNETESLRLKEEWLAAEEKLAESGTEREMIFPFNGTFLFTGVTYRVEWTGPPCSIDDKISIVVIPQGIASITPRWEVTRENVGGPNYYDWELSHLEIGDYEIIFALDFVMPGKYYGITVGQEQLSVLVHVDQQMPPMPPTARTPEG